MDAQQQRLPNAVVMIVDLGLYDTANARGEFLFDSLSISTFQVEITLSGYETLMKKMVAIKNERYPFQLKKTDITQLRGAKLKGNPNEQKDNRTSLSTQVVDEEFIKENLGGSLMQSLERLPGISSIDIGSGQSKPVIRGLGFNRVVVVENNVKHEAQQWGADHGLEIDQYAVGQVEVVKGPASLMYGSEAIGGVIDLQNRNVPVKNSIGGSIDLSGKTNNDFVGTSVSFFTRKDHFFATFRASIVDYGDYKVPTDSVAIYSYLIPLDNNRLRNTAGNEQNLHASFGFIQTRFQNITFISNVRSKYGFFANAHGLEPRNVDLAVHDASSRDILYPFQEVNHFKLINSSIYTGRNWKWETDLGFQRNDRQELSQYVSHGYMPEVAPEGLDFNPELERKFQKDIYSLNSRFYYYQNKKTLLTGGLNAEFKENEIEGRGFIIPAFQQWNVGGFALVKYDYSDQSIFQAGVRYDYGNVEVFRHQDWFTSPLIMNGDTTKENLERASSLNRNFSNFTWSLGYNYNPGKWSYQVNVGKSFRIPIAKELAANGVNYHRFSYEVGNAELSPEISYQLDAGINYQSKKWNVGATPFLNYFTNYIYLNPTSRFDRLYGFGNQVFEYTQSEVLRYGGEVHASFDATKHLQFGLIGEYIYAEQMSGSKKGFTLPFAPPASGIINVRYQQVQLKKVEDAYISFDYRLSAAQNNIVPPEVVTAGFQVCNLSLGGNLKFQQQTMRVAMQLRNIFNAQFFNHTSYYRLINVPEPGRNLVLNITIPIQQKINEQ